MCIRKDMIYNKFGIRSSRLLYLILDYCSMEKQKIISGIEIVTMLLNKIHRATKSWRPDKQQFDAEKQGRRFYSLLTQYPHSFTHFTHAACTDTHVQSFLCKRIFSMTNCMWKRRERKTRIQQLYCIKFAVWEKLIFNVHLENIFFNIYLEQTKVHIADTNMSCAA